VSSLNVHDDGEYQAERGALDEYYHHRPCWIDVFRRRAYAKGNQRVRVGVTPLRQTRSCDGDQATVLTGRPSHAFVGWCRRVSLLQRCAAR
jgi:hypothetical protein